MHRPYVWMQRVARVLSHTFAALMHLGSHAGSGGLSHVHQCPLLTLASTSGALLHDTPSVSVGLPVECWSW